MSTTNQTNPNLRLKSGSMRRLEEAWRDPELTAEQVRSRFGVTYTEVNWCREKWGEKARSGPSTVRALRNARRYA